MKKMIAVLRGDGIGPEIVKGTLLVLNEVAKKFGHKFVYNDVLLGGAAVDETGEPLPAATLEACLAADAVLLGAIGGPQWEGLPAEKRPEKGLLNLRAKMQLFANLRPAKLLPQLAGACPLRAGIAAAGIDFLIVRELIGGVYFGEHKTAVENGQKRATDIMAYGEEEIRRILRVAFDAARGRRGKVCSVDKANVLDTSRLWRAVAEEVAAENPDIEFSNMLVDNAAMQIVRNPAQFDVMVTENLFGDILSDEASMVTGSIGLIPSASLGAQGPGLFEPIHGSAPDIAGRDLANPLGTILSAAMLLRYSLKMPAEADAIEDAVSAALTDGLRTADMTEAGEQAVGCQKMSEAVAEKIAG